MITKKAWLPVVLSALFIAESYGFGMAANQNISLKAGWNLVSFAVQPENPAVDVALYDIIGDGRLVALWSYDAQSETWYTYPSPMVGIPAITTIQTGKGYWLKVTSATTLAISGTDNPPAGTMVFETGWNLVGFCTDSPKPYDRVFYNLPIREIWKYDAAAGQFKGIELPSYIGQPLLEDFTQLQPGEGYWVYATEAFTLEPGLGTAMEGDKDLPPLLNENPEYGVRYEWMDQTPGDEDIGLDGWYDQPDTQRALTFRDSMTSQSISVYNTGSGILGWSAQIDDSEDTPWLKFMVTDEETGEEVLVERLDGTVTTDTTVLQVVCDRSGMFPGDYDAAITFKSNGVGDEAARNIDVHMNVAKIDGDYKFVVQFDTVDGKRADMHSPRLFLSIYNDRDGLKGIVDEKQTLLMPERFYLTGQYYQAGTNRFILSGSLGLDVDSGDNPYNTPIRREITLLGDRSELGDAMLGPLDLKGEYRETIRNVLKEPIYLAGTFTATRIQGAPSAIDSGGNEKSGGPVPDDGALLESTIKIEERMIITEVDATVNLTHTRPADLRVTLISPEGTEVTLRDRLAAILGEATFDTDTTPVGIMADFNGEMSDGEWILRVEDLESGEEGELIEWSLDVKGTKVYSISGAIANVGEGATVLLTGCGLTMAAATDAAGNYQFDDLINCHYTITVLQQGFENLSEEIDISGANEGGKNLAPEKLAAGSGDFLLSPVSGLAPLQVLLTDISPPGLFESGHEYQYSWTFYRIVDGTPQSFAAKTSELPHIKQVFNQPGIYTAKMEIFDMAATGAPVVAVDKPDRYITVGPSGDGSYVLTSFTVLGAAGCRGCIADDEGTSCCSNENAFDSATFDIDRPPISSIGFEDTNAFTSSVDPATRTNQVGINGTLDPPVGPEGDLSRHFHIFVNACQLIGGRSVEGNKVLSIGANP